MFRANTKNSKNIINNEGGVVAVGDGTTIQVLPVETGLRRKILSSLLDDATQSSYIDDLRMFMGPKSQTETVGLEQKLKDAGFSAYFERASEVKEVFVSELLKNINSLSFQKIVYALIEEAVYVFAYEVSPVIREGASADRVMEVVKSRIFDPLFKEVADLQSPQFRRTLIEGLVFYVTGNCYLKWGIE